MNSKIEKNNIKQIILGKEYLEKELIIKKIHFFKSFGNFIHIDLKKKKRLIEKELFRKKILTRKGPGVKGLDTYLRITLGPKPQMQKVIKILNKFF